MRQPSGASPAQFDYVRGNRQNWDEAADWYAEAGERDWATNDITWHTGDERPAARLLRLAQDHLA